MSQAETILEIKDLCVEFQTVEGTVHAVDHLNYTLHKGEKLGIVGESGSGKSVSSLGMMQLIPNPPGRITGGEILYHGKDLVKASEKEMQKIRGNEISMIFQEPMTSLNPIIKCGKQIAESLRLHRGMKKKEAMEEAVRMMRAVGIANPETDYPRGTAEELSKVKDVLGTFTTSYSTSGAARCQNIATGTAHINGTVLYPGDTFSAYEAVSPFSEANGYAMAGSYLNGKVVDSLGGGICQVSTTLYNAVLRAELEVTERSNHSMIVTYVEPADDAAIAGTYKDLKFKNTLDAPVYIEGVTSGKQVTFTIYGQETRPSNRTLKFESVTLSTTEPGVQIIADAGQPIGYITRESAHKGVVAELYKHVYVGGKEESVTKVNKSNYKATPRTITVGIAGDPDLSNELQAAIATQDEATVNATLASCVARMQ